MQRGGQLLALLEFMPLPYVAGIKTRAVILACLTALEVMWAVMAHMAIHTAGLLIVLSALSLCISGLSLSLSRGKTESKAQSLRTLCVLNMSLRVSGFLALLYLAFTSDWGSQATCIVEPETREWTHHVNLAVVGASQAVQFALLLSVYISCIRLQREIKFRSLAHYLALY
jgi:hypothetical protein